MNNQPGRRIYPQEDGALHLAEGDYGFDPRRGYWMVRPPGHHAGGIPHHQVEEHPDGTITVHPSILLNDATDQGLAISWHGYLINGEWREL